jgi:hypothetical protein
LVVLPDFSAACGIDSTMSAACDGLTLRRYYRRRQFRGDLDSKMRQRRPNPIRVSEPTSLITCRIQNCQPFAVRVVFLGHQQNELQETSLVVSAGQCQSIQFPAGYVVMSVFNPLDDALVMCRVAYISGTFTFLIS